jgi:hypothetical protein
VLSRAGGEFGRERREKGVISSAMRQAVSDLE